MVDLRADGSARLEANGDYFLGTPLVGGFELTVMPDDDTAYGALADDDIDVVAWNVPPAKTDEIERNEELDIIGGTRNQAVYLMFDTSGPVLADLRVRQGLALALDVDVMLDDIAGGQGRLGTDTWTHPNSPWTRNATGAHLSDQLAGAQLLDAAGYPTGDDGARSGADGEPLVLTLGVSGAAPSHMQAAEAVAAQLGEVGVTVAIEQLDPAVVAAVEVGDTAAVPAVDMLVGELESHAHDDPDHLYFLFGSEGGGLGAAFARYTNPAFDALVVDALDEPTEAQTRLDLIHQAQDLLAADLPAIVLYYPAGLIAYRPGAYDGWTSDDGHGVLTKRSFLEPWADLGIDAHADQRPGVSGAGGPSAGGGRDFGWLPFAGLSVAAVALVGAFGLSMRTRGREGAGAK